MFTDTHCHISTKDYSDIANIIEKAKELGVIKMINNGHDALSNREVLELSKIYSELYPAIGFHPDTSSTVSEQDYTFIEENIDNIVAIGEIGLDYYYKPCDKEKQKEVFIRQLEIAQKYKMPVIIHSREATEDTINILKKFPTVRGSIHCFSGSLETAKIYIKMGYKLGLNGVVTFKNAKLKDVIKEIPAEDILLETDSPYLSPEPFRGKQNEPKNVFHIAKFIAETKNMTIEELSKITEQNVSSLFDI